jgi:DNA-binding LytR/AlgR family response regulator
METSNLLDLLERLEPGLVLFDNEFNITYINQSLLLIFPQISRDALFRGNLLQMHEEQTRSKIQEVVRLMLDASRPVPFTIKHMGHDRHERFLFLKVMPLSNDTARDALNCCLVYDITPFITNPQRVLVKIPVSTANGICLIDPQEIIYIKAENIYSRTHTAKGDFFCDLSLGVLEEGLSPQQFLRIHRSYIVNIGRVKTIDRDAQTLTVVMEDGTTRLPVSRGRAKTFLHRFGLR